MEESPSPTLSNHTFPSDKTEWGSGPPSPTSEFMLLEPPLPRNQSRQSYCPAEPSPLVNSYISLSSSSLPTPKATRPVTPEASQEPTSFSAHGPAAKTSSLSQGYVIIQQPTSESGIRTTPSIITISDSSSEVSESSSTTEEDFVYPTTPEPLPALSPPAAQLANLSTMDAPMGTLSPPPAQHTFILPPATDEDPEVNFLINLFHIRLTDIIQSYKDGRRPAIHIVESAPAPPYDPFTADRDDIYAEEPLPQASPLPVIHQPQPCRVASLPSIEILTTAEAPAHTLYTSPPPTCSCSLSSSRPVSPVVHLMHDTVGWNWSHPPTEGDEYTSEVPYDTGHSPLEMEWPKVVPLDDNRPFNYVDVVEIQEPSRSGVEQYYERKIMRDIRRLRPNLEFLAKRAIGMQASPVRVVRLKDQIPEPIFRHTFSHYATYAELEKDLSDEQPNGACRTNRWLCYVTRIRRTRQQFLELFASAQQLVKAHGYPEGLQSYVYIN